MTTPKNPAAQALGRLGAASRNRKLTPEQRHAIAVKAGQAFKANCAQRRADAEKARTVTIHK